jgi:proline dehydrogenase
VTGWRFSRKAASRFIAGDSYQEAVPVVRSLNRQGIRVSLNLLGEHTDAPQDATKTTAEIEDLLGRIQSDNLAANVSIKLTQIGASLGESLAEGNLERLLTRASEVKSFIRMDMENSPYTEITIRLCRRMRKKGYLNIGLVIQAYLHRSEQDLIGLLGEGIPVRLVKGAYREKRDLVFPRKADVNANYDRLAKRMIEAARDVGSLGISQDGRIPPLVALGTHDPRRLQYAKQRIAEIGLAQNSIEFQMIYGIRRDLQEQCVAEGYPMRVYVPFGTQWYPYYMRRLAERPANLWFFLSNLFRA